MSKNTDVLTRAAVRVALDEARSAAEREFDPWWSGYSSGATGSDLGRVLDLLARQLGRTLREQEEQDVRRGHADGERDRRESDPAAALVRTGAERSTHRP